ncbi:MAG TPA: RICIN domain-containing protein, partial [Polyangia bacterium]|nr:RICIN domain-containing protein [Polyangia bacterium]
MKHSSAPKTLALVVSLGALGMGCNGAIQGESTGGTSSAALVAQPPNLPVGVPKGFVATPVGYFHPSCLVHVNNNEEVGTDGTIRATTGQARAISVCQYEHYNLNGQPASPSLTGLLGDGLTLQKEPTAPTGDSEKAGEGSVAKPDVTPAAVTSDIEGWSLADFSTYSAGVSKLSVSWVVPPTPAKSGQVLFFFPGTQSLDGKSGGTILQPVLAYENSSWFVQSWNCCEGGGNAEYGDSVPVSPGDTILGVNTGTNCSASTGICNNWRVATTDQRTGQSSVFDTSSFGHPHQWIFAGVLEAYSLTSCDQLPTTGALTYDNFAISDINGNGINVPGMSWTDQVDNQLASCGNFWGGSQSGTNFNISFGGSRTTTGGTGKIVAPFSGKCLDINGAGTANGTKVQEWTCNGTAA